MSGAVAGLFVSMGLALVITALTLPQRQTVPVIDSLAWGGAHLAEASLGQKP
jgi:hypothetical protein